MKSHALQIFRAALAAADPARAVLRHLRFDGQTLTAGSRRYKLSNFDRIQIIGAGKASAAMASAVERLLGPRITGGLVNVPDGVTARLRRVELNAAGHPIPDQRGERGALRMLEIAREAGPRDLLICVISGGASALLPAPTVGLTLAAKQTITQKLLKSGANIHELNTVRKHLSRIKGGRLAATAAPARVLGLILSDVIGDDLDVIGSGPTVADRSTLRDACAILKKYCFQVTGDWNTSTQILKLRGVQNLIVGSNRLAIDAAEVKARALGYRVSVLSSSIEGEARDAAANHAALAKEILTSKRRFLRPACILSGGETTVTVRGRGLGGRNQEFVLAAAMALNGSGPVTIFSAGTDGLDGPTDAAGAIADARTMARAAKLGLNPRTYLDENDSYHFFERVGGLVKTGPTGTNVMDVRILLIT